MQRRRSPILLSRARRAPEAAPAAAREATEAWWARHRAELLRERRAAESPSVGAHAPHWSASPFDACA